MNPIQRRLFLHASAGAVAMLALSACQDKPAATTDPAAAAIAAAPKAANATEAYTLASQGHGLSVGAMMAANTVYVLFDPTCPHCARLWADSQPLLPRLKMVWIPVALRPSNVPLGAAIIGAPDPAAAMARNEALVVEGKVPPAPATAPPADATAKVEANTKLFEKLGAESVPYLVFRNAKTGTHGVHAGAVPAEQLAAMVGL